ncbi:MAG: hypothetical protein GY953_22475, partial [bacterium]|nr:hypothetical protein [bacterium]
MPLLRLKYEIRKVKGTEVPAAGYDVELQFRQPDGGYRTRNSHQRVRKFPHTDEFRQQLTAEELEDSHVRLRVVRNDARKGEIHSAPARLALGRKKRSYNLGRFRLLDNAWRVSGAVVTARGSDLRPEQLEVQLEVRSGQNHEAPTTLEVKASGSFGFQGNRMFLSPGKEFELLLKVL